MGNSPQIIFAHYRELVRPDEQRGFDCRRRKEREWMNDSMTLECFYHRHIYCYHFHITGVGGTRRAFLIYGVCKTNRRIRRFQTAVKNLQQFASEDAA